MLDDATYDHTHCINDDTSFLKGVA